MPAQGDRTEVTTAPGSGGLVARQQGLNLLRGILHPHPAMPKAWKQLLVGAMAAHDRFARLRFLPGPGHELTWHLLAAG